MNTAKAATAAPAAPGAWRSVASPARPQTTVAKSAMAATAAMVSIAAVTAPPTARAEADPLGAMIACSEVEHAQSRLACYDQAIRAIGARRGPQGGARATTAPSGPGKPPEDNARSGRGETRRETPPDAPNKDREHGTVLETTLEKAERDGFRRYLLYLANGQLWRQIGSGAHAGVRPGARVEVRRSAYGGFHARFDGLAREMHVEQIR